MAKKEESDLYYKLGAMHADIKNTYEQALKTNGRVTKMENDVIPKLDKRVDEIDVRMAKYLGVASVVIFLLQMFGSKLINKL